MASKAKTLDQLYNKRQFTANDIIKVAKNLGFKKEQPTDSGKVSSCDPSKSGYVQLVREGNSSDDKTLFLSISTGVKYNHGKRLHGDIMNTLREAERQEKALEVSNIISKIENMDRVGSSVGQGIPNKE